ncbi:MAG TPA: metallophosphoesterase [Myxococcales bacterium]|nr:metallophosphoesterase [Myxococcales bacterium]
MAISRIDGNQENLTHGRLTTTPTRIDPSTVSYDGILHALDPFCRLPNTKRPGRAFLQTAVTILILVSLVFFSALAHAYLWRRLVSETVLSSAWHKALSTLLLVGAIVLPGTLILGRFVQRAKVSPAAMPAYVWLGIVVYLLICLGAIDLVKWTARKIKTGSVKTPIANPERRVFLSRIAAGASVVGALGTVGYGVHSALGDVTTPRIDVALPRLPRALDGFRIVQLSDMHIGAVLGRPFIDYVVETANAQKPDIVVITGDLVDAPVDLIGPDVAALQGLKSRYGTYFVTGNHEYYANAANWTAFIQKLGIEVLLNRSLSVGDNEASFDLAGIPDNRGGWFNHSHTPDLPRATAGRDPDRELVVLAHRPSAIDWSAEAIAGLQLSGHTHGGQFFPIHLASRLAEPYVSGLHRHNENTQIYVSCGTGFWGPPMRVMAPAEVTTIVLRSV